MIFSLGVASGAENPSSAAATVLDETPGAPMTGESSVAAFAGETKVTSPNRNPLKIRMGIIVQTNSIAQRWRVTNPEHEKAPEGAHQGTIVLRMKAGVQYRWAFRTAIAARARPAGNTRRWCGQDGSGWFRGDRSEA